LIFVTLPHDKVRDNRTILQGYFHADPGAGSEGGRAFQYFQDRRAVPRGGEKPGNALQSSGLLQNKPDYRAEQGGVTTTELITERIVKESKILLKHTDWNVSEIAYSLGFEEASHFNNLFKKHTALSPREFRA
jgi:hypothetical protein